MNNNLAMIIEYANIITIIPCKCNNKDHQQLTQSQFKQKS